MPIDLPFRIKMLQLLLEETLLVDLEPNKMECFFANVLQPTELQGNYRVTDEAAISLSFKVSGLRDADMFDSNKTVDTFSVQAATPGIYRMCFNTLSTKQQEETELEFTLDQVLIATDRSTFGSVITEAENEMSSIENNYRSERKEEEELKKQISSGIWKMWIWFAIEVASCFILFAVEIVFMIKETKT